MSGCPSGLRSYVKAVVYSYACVQIPLRTIIFFALLIGARATKLRLRSLSFFGNSTVLGCRDRPVLPTGLFGKYCQNVELKTLSCSYFRMTFGRDFLACEFCWTRAVTYFRACTVTC